MITLLLLCKVRKAREVALSKDILPWAHDLNFWKFDWEPQEVTGRFLETAESQRI